MSDSNYASLIERTAAQYRLPAELVRAVIRVESAGSTFAVRYEPGFFDRYVIGKGHKRFGSCSRDTEERARATSYGLMQVMGQVAREEGFIGEFLTELCDPAVGIDFGCRHLARHARTFTTPDYGWDAVCAAYNGGAGAVRGPGQFRNPDYPAKILQVLGGRWPVRVA